MNNVTMPGLTPELYDPDLQWHAIQITVYEFDTGRGRSIKANVRAKIARNETWRDPALNVMINLQGRGRDARRARSRLHDECIKHDQLEVKNFMESTYHRLQEQVSLLASENNAGWRSTFLRSGFGRDTSRYRAGRTAMKPLNPGIVAHFDRASFTLGLSLGAYQHVERLGKPISAAQTDKNIIAYGIWLVEAPQYTTEPEEETLSARLNRFRTQS